MKKFIILLTIFIGGVIAGTWVLENSTNCWGQVCRSNHLCWRPDNWDVPALCLPPPLDPNIDWEYKVYDGHLALIDVLILILLKKIFFF